MTKFKNLFLDGAFNSYLESYSVIASLEDHSLYLRFDGNDKVIEASYTGPRDPWISSMCSLIRGQNLSELYALNWESWKETFKDDSSFWEHYEEKKDKFIIEHFELLRFTLDKYKGKEGSYTEQEALVCRCFGVRESEILNYIQSDETPTFEGLAQISKATKGCRSCRSQIKNWMTNKTNSSRYFKHQSFSEWILIIEDALRNFPKSVEWNMEVERFDGKQVVISYDKIISQQEEENTSQELQKFLGLQVDEDLGFLLIRSRHLSKIWG